MGIHFAADDPLEDLLAETEQQGLVYCFGPATEFHHLEERRASTIDFIFVSAKLSYSSL
jgi:hypothetical protein